MPDLQQYDELWADAAASRPTHTQPLDTLEFFHPAFLDENGSPTSVRVVCDTQNRMLLLEDFAPMNPGETVEFMGVPFDAVWPEIANGQVPSITIKVDNVGRELSKHLDAGIRMRADLEVRVRGYNYNARTDKTLLVTHPFTFTMRGISVEDGTVQGTCSPADLVNLQAMRLVYDLENYPGLNNV